MFNLTDKQKGYIAGIIDGEGYIGIGKKTWRKHTGEWVSYLQITNQNKEALELIQKLIGGTIVEYYRNSRFIYRLSFSMKPAEEVIKYLYPELIIKKKNADIFLKFRSTFKGIAGLGRGNFLDEKTLKIREECLKELRILNKKPYNEGKPFRGNVKSLRN